MANWQMRPGIVRCRHLAAVSGLARSFGLPARAHAQDRSPLEKLHLLDRPSGRPPILPAWFQSKSAIHLLRQIFACLTLLTILLTSCCTSVWAESPAKNVLLLFSGRFIAPLSIAVDAAVRATFQRSPSIKVELYAETLDVARFDPERYGALLAAYLREKFADRKPDLIITSLPQAIRFLVKYRKELFPDTPVVYCLVDEGELAGLTLTPNVTGVPMTIPWKETLDLALGVHPDTQHVVVIAGTDGLARVYLRETRELFRPYENRLAFTYLTDRTLPQLLKEVANLPPRTIIIYTTFAVDGAGRVYIDAEVSGMVAKAANAPVYSRNSTYLGQGITGGRIVDNGAHASRAAEIGLRILAGEKPENIVVGEVPSPPMFDARQLKRWNISERRLPAGSIVLFKGPSLWEQYRLLILALGVCLLEALLILSLLVHRRRRRSAEASLRENEERLRLAMNAAALDVWSWDIPGDRLRMSELVARMHTETPPAEVTYQEFLAMVDPEDRARVEAAVQQAIETGRDFEVEYRIPQRDGTVQWIASRGSCTHNQAGTPLRLTGVSHTITERKRAEDELRRHRERLEELVRERTAELTVAKDQAEVANQAKSVFLANMSHELRTPLNSILGLTQLLERDQEFPPRHWDNLRILSRSGRHLLELIDDVLELSRIEADKVALVTTRFDLLRLLDDVEAMMRPRADRKAVPLICERDPRLPRLIQTDERKLRQILLNLLSNAIRYTKKGHVKLRVRYRDEAGTASEAGLDPQAHREVGITVGPVPSSRGGTGRLECAVEDTGIGIAPEDCERIFEPFVQLNPGRSATEGAGLGLALCRRFVHLLGGELTVSSQIGTGTTFTFEIAVEVAGGLDADTHGVARQVSGLAPGQPSYHILVVDDNADNRTVVRQLLEQVGFRVLEAPSGLAALELHASHQPQLIVLDLRMPGMDGAEAAKRIRHAESGMRNGEGKEVHTPLIAMTASVLGMERPSGGLAVFDDWMRKPVSATELFDKLGKHLGVEYVYQASGVSDKKQDGIQTATALTPAALALLPGEWLEQFSRTLRTGRSAQLLTLLDQLPAEHAELARALADLVRIHEFDQLIALTKAALEESSHG